MLVNQCNIPMDELATLTELSQGSLIVVRVRARNVNGWSLRSQENISGAVIETVPHKVQVVSFNAADSTNTQIILTWDELTGDSTGGSPLIGHTVQYDQGIDSWIPSAVTGGLTSKTFTALSGGTTYAFKVAAVNKYGTGPYSEILQIVAA